MTYEQKANHSLQASGVYTNAYPWPVIILLVQAVVYALLSISAAVQSRKEVS